MMCKHLWETIRYALSGDRLTVSVVEQCRDCGSVLKYERPNKRLVKK